MTDAAVGLQDVPNDGTSNDQFTRDSSGVFRTGLPSGSGLAVPVAVLILTIVVAMAIFGWLVAPSYSGADYQAGAQHPALSWRFLFGSDVSGRPILQYVISGARNTFGVGLVAALLALVLGLALNSVRNAWQPPRTVLDLLTEAGLALPMLPVLLLLVGVVRNGSPWTLILVFGLTATPVAAALLSYEGTRAQPNAFGPVLDLTFVPVDTRGRALKTLTLLTVLLVSVSATIDFLGMGLPQSDPSWGNALTIVSDYLSAGYWWWLVFPGAALFLTLLALYTVGGALISRWEGGAKVARG